VVTLHMPGCLSRRTRVAVPVLVRVRAVTMRVMIVRLLRVRRRACVCRVVMTAAEAQHGRDARGHALQRQEKHQDQQCYASDANEHGGECKQRMAREQSTLRP
jgi:hypothetical protein